MPEPKLKVKSSKLSVRQAQDKKVEKPAKTAIKVSSKKAKDTLSLDIYDVKGKVSGSIELSREMFGASVNKKLIAQAVRVYLANQRSGTASTKTRGEVQGSTRKIYQQKGTGRARHGSVRAPIFVHGGVAFGPKPRDYSLDMPQKMRRQALFSALSAMLQEGRIKVIDGIEKLAPKTKEMTKVLQNLEISPKGAKILFVVPSVQIADGVARAVRNIKGVRYVQAAQVNTYEVLNNKMVLFMKDSLQVLEQTFMKGDK